MIQLKEALLDMERRDGRNRPVPFSIQFVTCDEHKDDGGDIIDLENVVLAKHAGEAKPKAEPRAASAPARPANEWQNGTRNFYILESQQTRKVDIRLITMYNNQPVL